MSARVYSATSPSEGSSNRIRNAPQSPKNFPRDVGNSADKAHADSGIARPSPPSSSLSVLRVAMDIEFCQERILPPVTALPHTKLSQGESRNKVPIVPSSVALTNRGCSACVCGAPDANAINDDISAAAFAPRLDRSLDASSFLTTTAAPVTALPKRARKRERTKTPVYT